MLRSTSRVTHVNHHYRESIAPPAPHRQTSKMVQTRVQGQFTDMKTRRDGDAAILREPPENARNERARRRAPPVRGQRARAPTVT